MQEIIMKKNLRFVLALTLGLATTVSAQDWSVDSRTRVNSTEDATFNEQRVRTAVDFGGDAVSAHVELNSTATLGRVASEDFSLTVREAYATTNVMEFASLTAGRMALNFGSGRILGDNNWVNGNGNTWDGFLIGVNNDFADIHVGYAATDMTDVYDATTMYFNVGKDMGAMAFNLLYVDTKEDVAGSENTSMGLDATYAMDNGVNLSLGYYTNDNNGTEMDLTSLGVSYAVNDDLTISYEVEKSTAVTVAEDDADVEQKSTGIQIAYNMGGMTLALVRNSHDNPSYSSTATDEDQLDF